MDQGISSLGAHDAGAGYAAQGSFVDVKAIAAAHITEAEGRFDQKI